jgi:hypothetical protein
VGTCLFKEHVYLQVNGNGSAKGLDGSNNNDPNSILCTWSPLGSSGATGAGLLHVAFVVLATWQTKMAAKWIVFYARFLQKRRAWLIDWNQEAVSQTFINISMKSRHFLDSFALDQGAGTSSSKLLKRLANCAAICPFPRWSTYVHTLQNT